MVCDANLPQGRTLVSGDTKFVRIFARILRKKRVNARLEYILGFQKTVAYTKA